MGVLCKMIKYIIFLSILRLSINLSGERRPNDDIEWVKYKKQYHKRYNRTEDKIRRKNWDDVWERLIKHNDEESKGKHTFKMRINSMSDWGPSRDASCLLKEHVSKEKEFPFRCNRRCQSKLPKYVDWRRKNIIAPIREQGRGCLSCYAFGATAVLEAHYAMATGKLVPLSVQEIVDCSSYYGNQGCGGGYPNATLQFVMENNGLSSDKDYPYYQETIDCNELSFTTYERYASVVNYYKLKDRDENYLKAVVARFGPVIAQMHIFQNGKEYGEGFLSGNFCDRQSPNHVVAIVGYGVKNDTPYWLIKNSYGESWGYGGYGYIIRDGNNQCGIATHNYIPVVK